MQQIVIAFKVVQLTCIVVSVSSSPIFFTFPLSGHLIKAEIADCPRRVLFLTPSPATLIFHADFPSSEPDFPGPQKALQGQVTASHFPNSSFINVGVGYHGSC